MKTNNTMIKTNLFWGALILAGVLFTFAFSPGDAPAKKYFLVAKKGQKVSEEKKIILVKAFKAVYGKNSKVSAVSVVKLEGKYWLAFVGGGNKTPTVTMELAEKDGSFILLTQQPLGINVCHTTDSCTQCKVGCGCGRNGGSGSCVEEKTEKVISNDFLQVLTPNM
jgi:hypothetical protein